LVGSINTNTNNQNINFNKDIIKQEKDKEIVFSNQDGICDLEGIY
jgi:hypothetical protein